MNNYNLLSKDVYDVDLSKGGMYREGKILDNTNYKVLDISRNGTYGNKNQYGVPNHMQAMTVAPVKDGVVDYSQLTIAYAGTNPDDKVDLVTDVTEVMDADRTLSQLSLGDDPLSKTQKLIRMLEPSGDQFDTALGYANYIQNRYRPFLCHFCNNVENRP